jgi:hypothetical protein
VRANSYQPRAQYIPDRPEYQHLRDAQTEAAANPEAAAADAANKRGIRADAPEIFGDAGIKIGDYWTGINKYFDGKSTPDTKMPTVNDIAIDYEPEIPDIAPEDLNDDISVSLEDVSLKETAPEDEAIAAEGEASSEEGAEGEEEKKDEEDPPKLKKEAYMTKAYYMPGYVDKTPEKEYPPHIRAFKNYLKQIGEFEKHGYEKEDYSPDSSAFAPDTSGFAPDSSGFAPNTSSFAPDTSTFGVTSGNYKTNSPMGNTSQFRPNYGDFKPTVTHMRGNTAGYKPNM